MQNASNSKQQAKGQNIGDMLTDFWAAVKQTCLIASAAVFIVLHSKAFKLLYVQLL